MKSLFAALRFLTIFPVPGPWGHDEEDLARSVPWFPVVGLLLGFMAATAAAGLFRVAPPLVVSGLLVALLVAFSGGLHLDGLADTADGFFSSRPRERMLEIMKDSRTGAMGVCAIVLVLLLKFAAIAALAPRTLLPAMLLAPLCGRAMLVVHLGLLPYARREGRATLFCRYPQQATAVWAVTIMAVAAWFVLGLSGLALAGLVLLATLLLAAYVRSKIGGLTGDTLGALCELVELLVPLALTIWPLREVLV